MDDVAQAYRDAAYCDLDADWYGEPETHDSDVQPGGIPVQLFEDTRP
jgi:hypothetical protein